jgi:DNA gyrase subunit A
MYEIPEGKRSTKGKAIVNFLSITPEEKVTSCCRCAKIKKRVSFLYMITKQGTAKKVDATAFHDVRRSGLIARNSKKAMSLSRHAC